MKLNLNALGIVNPLGKGKAEVARNLQRVSQDGLAWRDDFLPDRPVRAGVVREVLPPVPERLAHLDCRNNQLALAALQEIQDEVMTIADRVGPRRVAVVAGTSTSGIAEGEAALAQQVASGSWPRDFRPRAQEIGSLAGFIADICGLAGPAYTISTACSSSAKAFASAARLIEAGLCDAAVVGGVDTLCRMTFGGFDSLEALSKDRCNPFSRNRDGINIGEGAALFLMTREESPVTLLGVGESSDAYHVSSPHPDGDGAVLAMRRALDAADLKAEEIQYINLHGTGTELNDLMEARAVSLVLGDRTLCSSTKSITGHMLGAAGANEAGFIWLMLDPRFADGSIPPHIWDGEYDPALARLNFTSADSRFPNRERIAALSNSFAFGGSNATVVLGRGW